MRKIYRGYAKMSFIRCQIFMIFVFINVNSMHTCSIEERDHKSGPAHFYEVEKGFDVLRSPETRNEWKRYHEIRKQEIVKRYCPQDYKYNKADSEELCSSNYRFIFTDTSLQNSGVIGVIRVDLLERAECSIRWVAIASEFQDKGYGKRMLELVQQFAMVMKRNLIRVPSEEASKGFYTALGFKPSPWPDAPKNDGNIFLAKKLYKSDCDIEF